VNCRTGRGTTTPSEEATRDAIIKTIRMAPAGFLAAMQRLYTKSTESGALSRSASFGSMSSVRSLGGGGGTRDHKSRANKRYKNIRWDIDPTPMIADRLTFTNDDEITSSEIFNSAMSLPRRALFHDILGRALEIKQSQELYTYNGIIAYIDALFTRFQTSGSVPPEEARTAIKDGAFRVSEADREAKQTRKKKPSVSEYQKVMTKLKSELRADPVGPSAPMSLSRSSTVGTEMFQAGPPMI
jgi:hypothetical protein